MKAIAGAIAMIVAVSLGVAVHAQTPTDPEGVFRAVVDAFNAGDAAAAAAYFSEDATVIGLCQPADACHGRAEIQGALEEEIAHNAQDEIRSLTVNGDTVTVALSESSPGFAEFGIERVYINITATVQNGLITSMVDELDLTDEQTATFARAMEQQGESSLPPTGTGYTAPTDHIGWWVLAALLAFGGGALAVGTGLTRRPAGTV